MPDLRISDGTTTVTLTGTDGKLKEGFFVPLSGRGRASVTERVDVYLEGTATVARGVINTLNRLFEKARLATEQGRADGWIEFRPTDAGGEHYYRSPLRDGFVEQTGERPDLQQVGAIEVEVTVGWTREPWWEDQAGTTAIALSNAATPATTSLVTVYNEDGAAGHDNYVDIAAAQVTGDVDAPAILEIVAGADMDALFVGHGIMATPGSFVHVYEGELGGGGTADANSSGNEYKSFAITGTLASVRNWSVSAASLQQLGGQWVKIFIRTQDAPVNTSVRFKLLYGSAEVAVTETVTLDATHRLQEAGSLQLPPFLVGSGATLTALTLILEAKKTGGGNLLLDRVELIPVGPQEGSFRKYTPIAAAYLASGEALWDDRVAAGVYKTVAGARVQQHVVEGEPIMLRPGQNQRLYFLWHSHATSGGATTDGADASVQVRVTYRPRRDTL